MYFSFDESFILPPVTGNVKGLFTFFMRRRGFANKKRRSALFCGANAL